MPALEIPAEFDRSAYRNQERTAESARFLLRYVCDVLGLPDLSESDVLDVGCGTKMTEAFVNDAVPIRSYVGVDVYREMIDFLSENISDTRFEYHHTNVHNELYNPDAPPMTVDTDLGVGDRKFDIIWLFSVFTHLAPHDYSIMLRLLRRYIRPHGRLIYTLFIDELTDGGYGYIDRINRGLGGDAASGPGRRKAKSFVDVDPEHPLLRALYSREYAYELIDGTGWSPLKLLPPNEFAQHHFVCAPV